MAPRDYKERPAQSKARKSKPARRAPTPRRGSAGKAVNVVRWRWFGSGLCVGSVATAALFLYEPSVVRHVGVSAGAPDVGVDEPPRTRFEFYTLLTEKERVVPNIEEPPPPAKKAVDKKPSAALDATTPPVAAVSRGKYLLQVGSFRSLEDADRLKAKLAFLGLEGSIQTISIDGKETWHRVRVGPYTARAQLEEARAMLKANKYDALLLKLTGQ
jgi:cell division protein FtsN